MVTTRALITHVKEEVGDEIQCENVFHPKCHIYDKTCNVIIDRGSCANVTITTLVEKLRLSTLKHSRPYNLQWLNDSGVVLFLFL